MVVEESGGPGRGRLWSAMCALQVRKREWNLIVGPDFYAIRFRSPKAKYAISGEEKGLCGGSGEAHLAH